MKRTRVPRTPGMIYIDPVQVQKVMHGPNGIVTNFHEEIGEAIVRSARRKSWVGNPLNAMHRTKWAGYEPYKSARKRLRGRIGPRQLKKVTPVGTYKNSWYWTTRRGTNKTAAMLEAGNSAPYAVFQEFGRSASKEYQVFTWTDAPLVKMRRGRKRFANPGWKWWLISAGARGSLLPRTRARPGNHILERSSNSTFRRFGI